MTRGGGSARPGAAYSALWGGQIQSGIDTADWQIDCLLMGGKLQTLLAFTERSVYAERQASRCFLVDSKPLGQARLP